MSTLAEVGTTIATVAEQLGEAVIGLGARWGMGSGVVIDEGLVLTNSHNVEGDRARIGFADGRIEEGRVRSLEVDRDLALVDVDTGDTTPVSWASDEVTVSVGTPVISCSNPGGRGVHVTIGFVSATDRSFRGPRGRRIRGGFEHTAPAVPGSSGGPVADIEGNLIGLNTRRMQHGFYIAQTADSDFKRHTEELRRGERSEPRRLGVGLAPAGVTRRLRSSMGLSDVEGLLVRYVEEGSPAATAGLVEGDVIVEAGGALATDLDDLHQAIAGAGDSLELKLVRINDELSVVVELT